MKLPNELAKIVPTLIPAEGVVSGAGQWCLARPKGDYIVYNAAAGREIEVNVPAGPLGYRVHWIDSNSGEIQSDEKIPAASPIRLRAKTNVLWLEHASAN